MSVVKPKVQIGPVSNDPAESVSCVNKSFINGLQAKYHFVIPSANRRYGNTKLARVNLWNLYYLAKHTACWIWSLLWHRPVIAHYAISSGWAMQKGLLFLRLARAFGVRTVGHLHSGAFLDHWKNLPEKKRAKARAQLLKLDAFIVLSERWRQNVINEINLQERKVFVVNNPIEEAFEAEALQMPLQRPGRTILALGVMGRDKGVYEIIAAVDIVRRSLPDICLVLAGPEREPGINAGVKREIANRNLGGTVVVLPGVFGAKKANLYKEASVFVLPSYYENFPLVVLEAAAAGQAIIATPVGAIPEFFLDGESALFVEIGSAADLANAILAALQDPAEQMRLAKGAREIFTEKLSRGKILDSLDGIYEVILSRNAD